MSCWQDDWVVDVVNIRVVGEMLEAEVLENGRKLATVTGRSLWYLIGIAALALCQHREDMPSDWVEAADSFPYVNIYR